MMKYIHFFALKEDLLHVLNELESKRPTRYVLSGHFNTPKAPEWYRAADIPELGIAHGEQSMLCRMYLLTDWQLQVQADKFQLFSGETRFSIDQRLNPDTIVMNPGGLWKPDIIISGSFATISENPVAQSLMRIVRHTVRRSFTRIKAFWVGPEALKSLRSGWRLTGAEQSPREFDLQE